MPSARSLVSTSAFRWTFSIAGGFTAMVLALFGFIYWQTAIHTRLRIDGLLLREADYIATLPPGGAETAVRIWIAEDLHAVRYAGIFAAEGQHLCGNLLAMPPILAEDGQVRETTFIGIDRPREGRSPEVVRAVATRLAGGAQLVLGYDVDELEDVQEIILRALILGLLPTVALSLAGGLALARRTQRRVASFHGAVARIMDGHLGDRLPVSGSRDDMDRLAAAVNGMLDEIERLVEEIRGIGDNIAHDLRTPLTRVRTRLERGRDEAQTEAEFQACIDRAIESVDQALAVVSAVLRIGEIEHSRRQAAFAVVDLTDIASDAYELYQPLAEEKDLSLCLHLAPCRPVWGDRDLILEAIGNLLDNALKFAPPGTEVTVSVTGGPERTSLKITDRGCGIPALDRERVLQRFYRGEKSRTINGSGLGLNLVSAITALHGFTLTIGDADPGCVVAIDCPATGATAPSPVRTGRTRLARLPS